VDGLPFLLILDEYCDKDVSSVQTAFLQSLRKLCKLDPAAFGQVIIITHSRRVIRMCDTAIIMKNGQIYANGRPEKVLKDLPSNMVVLD
jgi:ABC-type glutathione transport system ATPase component